VNPDHVMYIYPENGHVGMHMTDDPADEDMHFRVKGNIHSVARALGWAS
jgi:hypothetical protein